MMITRLVVRSESFLETRDSLSSDGSSGSSSDIGCCYSGNLFAI